MYDQKTTMPAGQLIERKKDLGLSNAAKFTVFEICIPEGSSIRSIQAIQVKAISSYKVKGECV